VWPGSNVLSCMFCVNMSPPVSLTTYDSHRNLSGVSSNSASGSSCHTPSRKTADSNPNIAILTADMLHCIGSQPLSPDHATTCKLLSFFHMYFSPVLGCIICTHHALPCIVPMATWSKHAATHEFSCPSYWRKGGKPQVLETIAVHVAEIFPVLTNQTGDDIVFPERMLAPLFMDSPETQNRSLIFAYSCPHLTVDGAHCGEWIARNNSYRGGPEAELWKHITRVHGKIKRQKSYLGQWTQNTRVHPNTRKRLLLPLDWQPPVSKGQPTPLFPPSVCVALPNASWMSELKWDQYRRSLGRFNVSALHALIVTPSQQSVARKSAEGAFVEAGLLALHREIYLYLRTANEFASNTQLAFRAGLTTGTRYMFYASHCLTVLMSRNPVPPMQCTNASTLRHSMPIANPSPVPLL
jgi:hypothetical protein